MARISSARGTRYWAARRSIRSAVARSTSALKRMALAGVMGSGTGMVPTAGTADTPVFAPRETHCKGTDLSRDCLQQLYFVIGKKTARCC
jgi:hypothetical protein